MPLEPLKKGSGDSPRNNELTEYEAGFGDSCPQIRDVTDPALSTAFNSPAFEMWRKQPEVTHAVNSSTYLAERLEMYRHAGVVVVVEDFESPRLVDIDIPDGLIRQQLEAESIGIELPAELKGREVPERTWVINIKEGLEDTDYDAALYEGALTIERAFLDRITQIPLGHEESIENNHAINIAVSNLLKVSILTEKGESFSLSNEELAELAIAKFRLAKYLASKDTIEEDIKQLRRYANEVTSNVADLVRRLSPEELELTVSLAIEAVKFTGTEEV